MGAEAGLIWIVLSAVLLFTTAGIGLAYRRSRATVRTSIGERDAYMQVFDGGNDAVLVIDFVDGRILRANERAAQLLGHTKERMLALTVFDLHAPEHLALSATRIADAWEKKGMVYSDIPFRSSTDEMIQVECSTTVTYHGDRPAIVLFARDIRERVRLQREVDEQQALVREKSDELQASLRYASTIQNALLPSEDTLRTAFTDAFVFFRPRDIVSGDLYWTAQMGTTVLVAVADCTGHGVPGAFLSMIGNSLLRTIVLEKGITDPGAVLEQLRASIVGALGGSGDQHVRDGMDIALLAMDRSTGAAWFAGAMNPLYVVRGTRGGPVLIEHKADRMPIGFVEGIDRPFTTVQVELLHGDRVFLFSDGFADQFGGSEGRKLKSSGFKRALTGTGHLPMAQQGRALVHEFDAWRGAQQQTDDVLVVGLLI